VFGVTERDGSNGNSHRPGRLRAIGSSVAVLALAGVAAVAGTPGTPTAKATDKDCPDFKSQREAQLFFEAHGGPDEDPHGLDGGDGDGVACEDRPPPRLEPGVGPIQSVLDWYADLTAFLQLLIGGVILILLEEFFRRVVWRHVGEPSP
jgi:Excalibur calcium-binding domain